MPGAAQPVWWAEPPLVRLDATAAARVLPSRRWPGGDAPSLAPGTWRLFDERRAVELHLLPDLTAEALQPAMQALVEGPPAEPGQIDPDLKAQSDGLYLAILMARLRHQTPGSAARFFDVLAERQGLLAAVRAFVVALGVTVRVEYEQPDAPVVSEEGADAGTEDSARPPLQIRVWADPAEASGTDGETTLCAEMWRVRAWLAHADDATWLDCAMHLSASLDTLPPARRPLAAVMLPERAALSDRLLGQLLALDHVPETAQWLLLTVSNPSAVAEAVAHAVRVHPAYPIFRKSLYVATLLQERGEAALDVLLPLSTDHGAAADGLVSIGRPEAMMQLCTLALRHEDGLQRLRRAVQQWPQLAMRVLAERLSRQSHTVARLRPVLVEAVARSPRAVRQVTPYLDALARAVLRQVQKQLTEQVQRPQAALDELPPALMAFQPQAAGGAMARLPDFWQPRNWPRPVLKGSGGGWPDEAFLPLGQLLAATDQPEATALLAQVRECCEPGSLETFGWQLFQSWKAAGASEFYPWAVTRLAWAGTDETARRLGAVVLDWSAYEADGLMCRLGLGVLREIGSDVALMQIAFVMQHAHCKSARQAARAVLQRVAGAAGLGGLEELLDQRVPDLGLGAQGVVVLDFGPRQFSVRLGEHLKPVLAAHGGGRDGRRLSHLPRPQPGDDPALSAAARKRFNALRGDLRLVAGLRTRALETAMTRHRRWPLAAGRQLMTANPVMRVLVQSLVWCVFQGPLRAGAWPAFRLDLEGRVVGVDDDDVILPGDEGGSGGEPGSGALMLGLAHPLDLTEAERAGFVAQLADYRLLQPFEQLGRPCHVLDEAGLAATSLARWEGRLLSLDGASALKAQGWFEPLEQRGLVLARPVDEPDGARCLCLSLSHVPLASPQPGALFAASSPDKRVGVLEIGLLSGEGGIEAPEPLAAVGRNLLSDVIWQLDEVLR